MQPITLSVASNAPCQRCEGLPEKLVEAGQLYLWFPLGHSLGKALAALHQARVSYERLGDEQSVRISLREGEIEPLVAQLAATLSGEEMLDTQTLFTTDLDVPALTAFPQVIPLKRFIGKVRSGWLVDLLHEQRLTCHFQPIVHAAAPGRLFAHEALLRGIGPDGAPLAAGPILDLGREAGLLFQLDLLARRTAIREADARGIGGKIFINFNPTAIYDPVFCLRSTVAAIDATRISRDRIVFEVTESDRTQDLGHLQRILYYYRDAGFAVALDDFGSGYSSLNLLHQLRPDYLKLDIELIRDVDRDPYKASIARKILEVAQELDLRTIAEGIERPEELAWAHEHGADYLQGYLLGRPAEYPTLAYNAA